MPLLYQPLYPLNGVKRRKRTKLRPDHRKKLAATVTAETKAFMDSMHETMSYGRLIDDAIRLYRELNQDGTADTASH